VVSTRVLSPGKAVIWAAFFNFVAAVAFGTAVAQTVGAGMVDLRVVTFTVIFAGLTGAIIWDLITWYWGLPTSSSHALFGGYAGAAVAKAGFSAVIVAGWTKTIIFIIVAPIIGMSVGWLLMVASLWTFRHASPHRVDVFFRKMQLLSAAAFSLMHGANDAQKTMGIISGALVTGGYLQLVNGDAHPLWVILLATRRSVSTRCRAAGASSRRWVKTAQPIGFSAETGAALAIYTATLLGVGISTTHTITGAIVGVGSTRRLSAVRWGVAGQIVWAWLLTIPASAVLGAVTYGLVSALFGAT
jgi:PiT family inorganic phosphate transporter